MNSDESADEIKEMGNGKSVRVETEASMASYASLKELAYAWPVDGKYYVKTVAESVSGGEIMVKMDGNSVMVSFGVEDATAKEIRERLLKISDYNGGDAAEIVRDRKPLTITDRVTVQMMENEFVYKISVDDDGSGQKDSKSRQLLEMIPVFAGDELGDKLLRADLMKGSSDRGWVNESLMAGEIKIDDVRSIPIETANGTGDLINHIGEVETGKTRLYHGTSLDAAIGMVRVGFFGRGPESPKLDFPSLSDKIDGIPSQFAGNSSVDKVIVVFECDQNEFVPQGGYGENVGVPGVKFDGDRDKLRAYLPNELITEPDLRTVPKERIKKIIYIK